MNVEAGPVPPQRFAGKLRYAIWKAYDHRCFYCDLPLRYRDMSIDHIIPQHLTGDRLAEFLRSCGLDASWDPEGLCNTVPSCVGCNGKKSDLLARPRQVVLLTTIASSRVRTVETLLAKLGSGLRADKVLTLIERALHDRAISREDIEHITSAQDDVAISLTAPINFVDLAVSELSPDDLERFRREPLANIAIEMQLTDQSVRAVSTVAEYDNARSLGGFAHTATDLRCEGYFNIASAILAAVQSAQPADISFIDDPHVGVCDLALMPSSLIQYLGEHQIWRPRIAQFPTLEAFVQSGNATIESVSSSRVALKFVGGIENTIWELLRADLDGDGIEDMLAVVHCRATGGTHGHTAEPIILTRKTPTSVFEMRIFPMPQGYESDYSGMPV